MEEEHPWNLVPGRKCDSQTNPQAISNIHRSYLDGTRLRDGLMKEFVEDVGEFNPHEITEEQSKQAEKEAEQKQAAEAGNKDNGNIDPKATKAGPATRVAKQSTFNTEHSGINSKLTLTQSLVNKNTAGAALPSKMSYRGGRGGARGGGGLKGATWEHDPDVKLESKPSDLFPRHPNLKKPKPLTGREKRQIKNQKKLQDDIRRGPFYTEPTKRDADAPAKTFSEAQFNSQYGNKGKADIDPFHGVETYSQKYAPKKRTIPQLSARAPFNKELFPKELWGVLEGEAGEEVRKHVNRIAEKKAALMGATTKDKDEKTRILLEKIKNAGVEDDAEMVEDEEPAEEEPEDYDFEEDEEEMGGDYDGEKYFDNGEGDSGDDGDGGNNDY